MKITPEQVMHVANLARLRVDPQAVDKLARQMATILDYVDTLGQVETREVPPTFHAIGLTNAFRDDIPRPHLPSDQSLANAPAQEAGGFVVPKVI
jgi:aspartyl-tRNA(Asn)/glutamyl-tRNA(Gln) amidotransferase subunit C